MRVSTKALLAIQGPCDADFGQQVRAMKGRDILCVDDLASAIDGVEGQEAWIVNPTSLFSLDGVQDLYVKVLSFFRCVFLSLIFSLCVRAGGFF